MRVIIISALTIMSLFVVAQPCTTTNASGCSCPDGRDTCVLLPDLNISWLAITDYKSGPNEFSQTGNANGNNGRLRLTGATPNIGYGSFTVRGSNYFLCGTDTVFSANRNPTCSNGLAPTNLLYQRIYKKMGNTMTYEDVFTGGQTFHPTHGHNHVDDWVVFTLRMEDPNNPDTLSWPIVGEGAKIGFCLMDYNSCNDYPGYCRDNQMYQMGNALTQPNFPNYGLGGGQYNCSPVEQGISSGFMDIYDEDLDGMWINIPPGTCNGNYWIVAQVDPLNSFLESDETNNWTAVPVTLTKQTPAGNAVATVDLSGERYLCNGQSLTLTANLASSYLWSNGETTRSITVQDGGNYSVQINTACGSATSSVIEVVKSNIDFVTLKGDTSCQSRNMILTAEGNATTLWYDSDTSEVEIYSGAIFETPVLNNTKTYYAELKEIIESQTYYSAPTNHSGTSNFSGTQYNGSIIFDAYQSFILKTVKVYSDIEAVRIIELRDMFDNVLQSKTINIMPGMSRITLNFEVPAGIDLRLGTNTDNNLQLFGFESPQLRRSSSGVNYPYTITDVVSLKDSPNGSSFYYYFYDWEIYREVSCISERVPVTALFNNVPQVTFTLTDTLFEMNSGVVSLTGNPAGGTFSGQGVSGNTFNPALAGVGGPYTITYNYTEPNSACSNFATQAVSVYENPTGVISYNDITLHVYPNPAKKTLQLHFNKNFSKAAIQLYNTLGALVKTYMVADEKNIQLPIEDLHTGLYFGDVIIEGKNYPFRFLKH